jgi:hypothetical protein
MMIALLSGLASLKRKISTAMMKGNRIRKLTTLKIGIDKVFRPFHIKSHNYL